MNSFLQALSSSVAPGLLLLVIVIVLASGFKQGWIGQFITALNSLNTPWVAIIVVVIGMIYNLKCKAYGLPSDSANQVIGGGLGLLTGQALKNKDNPMPAPPLPSLTPTMPEEPAQPK